MVSRRFFALCVSVSLFAVGCSTSRDASDTSSSNLTDDAGAPSADAAPVEQRREPSVARPNIPRSEVIHQYSGQMRVSFDNGALVEEEWATPAISFNYSDPAPWSISGPVRIDFGHSPATTLTPGDEFSCAKGDAKVMTIENGGEGALVARNAATCTVVIEEVSAPTSDRFVRVHGYFVADSNLPDGLPHQTSGTFAGDFPLPLREAPQP